MDFLAETAETLEEVEHLRKYRKSLSPSLDTPNHPRKGQESTPAGTGKGGGY